MEVLIAKGPIDSPKSFHVREVHRPDQLLGLNIYKILCIDIRDSIELIEVVCSRIRARCFAKNPLDGVIYQVSNGERTRLFKSFPDLETKTYMEMYGEY